MSESILGREHAIGGRLVAVLSITAATGYITLVFIGGGVWQQWTYLAHTLFGVVFSLIFALYLGRHFRRTIGLRRLSASVLGILSVLGVLALVVTGLHISVLGQSEAQLSINTQKLPGVTIQNFPVGRA